MKRFENPNWKPLEEVVGPDGCEAFMWIWREADVEFYKHILTRRYLLLDSTGQCFRRGPKGFVLTDIHAELDRVTGGTLGMLRADGRRGVRDAKY